MMCRQHHMYLCVSYDTDLIALESLTGFVSKWSSFTEIHDNLTIEIRTKSFRKDIYDICKPCPRTIFAYTLSPQEVINRYETNLFTSVAELRDFLIQWNLPGCRIHLDTFHMNIEEADMVRAIEIAGDSLGYFHVADSNRLAPGRGHLDFSAMFAALERVGYHGTISLECIPQPDSLSTGAEGYLYLTKMLNNH